MLDSKIQEQIDAGKLTPITNCSPEQTNWQLFATEDNKVWSIAIVEGAKNSVFGDKRHLLNVLRRGGMKLQDFNEKGIEFLSGLNNRLIGEPGSGKEWWLLSLG